MSHYFPEAYARRRCHEGPVSHVLNVTAQGANQGIVLAALQGHYRLRVAHWLGVRASPVPAVLLVLTVQAAIFAGMEGFHPVVQPSLGRVENSHGSCLSYRVRLAGT